MKQGTSIKWPLWQAALNSVLTPFGVGLYYAADIVEAEDFGNGYTKVMLSKGRRWRLLPRIEPQKI